MEKFGEVFVLQGLIMMMLMDELLQCRNILRINERKLLRNAERIFTINVMVELKTKKRHTVADVYVYRVTRMSAFNEN